MLALTLSACGDGDDPEPLPEPEAEAPEEVSELDPDFVESMQFMTEEELAEILPMLEASGDLYDPSLTVDLVVVNPLDQRVRVDSDLLRLLHGDGLASAPSARFSEALEAGTSTELDVRFELPTASFDDLVLRLGTTDRLPVLCTLPDGPVLEPEPVTALDLELEGEYQASRDRGETTLAVTLLSAELRSDIGPERTSRQLSDPTDRRAEAGKRWLFVELDVVNLGGEDRDPRRSSVRVTEDDVRLMVDDRPLGLESLESPDRNIELDEQQVWNLYVQLPIDAEDVELRVGDPDDPLTAMIDLSDIELMPGELD